MTAMTLATAKQCGAVSSGGRFLRVPDEMKTTGLGRSTIYRMVAAGTFPQQVKLTVQASGGWQADVDGWMRDRLAACPPALLSMGALEGALSKSMSDENAGTTIS